jgi:CRP/FNR family transcriptional regulator, cyclic AMP receptor protein
VSTAFERPFGDEHLKALAALGVERSYARNTVLIQKGDRGDQLYLVRSGRLKVYFDDGDGKEVTVEILGPDYLFGELAPEVEPPSASVMTLEPSQVVTIPRDRFRVFLAENPDAAWSFIDMLVRRSRDHTRTVGSLAPMDIYGRVARLLLDRARDSDGGPTTPDPMTQAEIAERVGASREMIARIVADLREGGYIALDDLRVVIRRTPPAHW